MNQSVIFFSGQHSVTYFFILKHIFLFCNFSSNFFISFCLLSVYILSRKVLSIQIIFLSQFLQIFHCFEFWYFWLTFAPFLLIKLIAGKKKTNFMVPFYGWGSTASRLQPLRGGSLLFTIQFPATHIFAAETVNCICAAGSNCIIATE